MQLPLRFLVTLRRFDSRDKVSIIDQVLLDDHVEYFEGVYVDEDYVIVCIGLKSESRAIVEIRSTQNLCLLRSVAINGGDMHRFHYANGLFAIASRSPTPNIK